MAAATSPIRRKEDFSMGRLMAQLEPPGDYTASSYSWTVPQIRAARDLQLQGRFLEPVKMAAQMGTDDAIHTAREARLDPQRCISVSIDKAKGGRASDGERIAGEAEELYGNDGVAVTTDVLADIHRTLADHGIAIGYNVPRVRKDGSRIDLHLRPWPLEYVRYDELTGQLLTKAQLPGKPYIEVPIEHGDGRWVVFAKHNHKPWRQEAAILPGCLIWARHATGVRDWVKGSTSHGNAKVVATMPDQMAITNKDGSLTREAQEILALLRAVASQEKPIGIAPFGTVLQYLTNASRAWEVWRELVLDATKSAARVWLGTDGILGAQGGAPGVDITALFGVALTKVQGDLSCLERCFHTGTMEVWAALNHGDSSLAPRRRYQIPDPDAAAKVEQYAKASEAFHKEVAAYKRAGFVLDESTIAELAKIYGVRVPALDVTSRPQPSPAVPDGADTPPNPDETAPEQPATASAAALHLL